MRALRFLLPLCVLLFVAGASKPKVSVRFHVEVNPNSGEAFTMSSHLPGSGRAITLGKTAEISEQDIVAMYPFPDEYGTSGCTFKLNAHGRIKLDSLSMEARGGTLIGFVNGRAVTAMIIDRRVSDGIISINSSLQPEEIALMAKVFPVLGQPRQTKKKR